MLLATVDITTVIVAVITAIATLMTGGLLFYGPQKKNLTAAAADSAISAIDKVRATLESRLEKVEHELETARDKIRTLEAELEAARQSRRADVADLERERERLRGRVEQLEAQVGEFRRRLPERRPDEPRSSAFRLVIRSDGSREMCQAARGAG